MLLLFYICLVAYSAKPKECNAYSQSSVGRDSQTNAHEHEQRGKGHIHFTRERKKANESVKNAFVNSFIIVIRMELNCFSFLLVFSPTLRTFQLPIQIIHPRTRAHTFLFVGCKLVLLLYFFPYFYSLSLLFFLYNVQFYMRTCAQWSLYCVYNEGNLN